MASHTNPSSISKPRRRSRGTSLKRAKKGGKSSHAHVAPTRKLTVERNRRHEDAQKPGGSVLHYNSREGVDAYVWRVKRANPLQLVQLERVGVSAAFINDLSAYMGVSAARMFDTLGVSKATAARKATEGKPVTGSGGHAAIAMAKLLGMAQEILANSTAAEAERFDAAKWLGQWIERPQPSLGGSAPAELLATPTGFEVVARLLRAIESGSYQ
jgi:putative toxin-antitoxin system antitoxin component (TIGR02293 family)